MAGETPTFEPANWESRQSVTWNPPQPHQEGRGEGAGDGLQDLGNLWRPGPLGVKGCPGWASHLEAGSSASDLGHRASAPRAPVSASKPSLPGRRTGSFRHRYFRPPRLSSPTRSGRPVRSWGDPARSHAPDAGSSFQLRECIGQFGRPARAGEGEAPPAADCAGVNPQRRALIGPPGKMALRMRPAVPRSEKCLQVSAGGHSGLGARQV